MSGDLAALADETADRLGKLDLDNRVEMRSTLGYATGVLRALAVALRPTPPPTRPAAMRSAGPPRLGEDAAV